jgi:hypothetical protein
MLCFLLVMYTTEETKKETKAQKRKEEKRKTEGNGNGSKDPQPINTNFCEVLRKRELRWRWALVQLAFYIMCNS